MTVYISGPITGKRDNNRRAFEKAAVKITEAFSFLPDVTIINPLAIGREVDSCFNNNNRGRLNAKKPGWTDYMRADLKRLCDADCVYFLKGWEKSKGAALERHIAETLGIPCSETLGLFADCLTEDKAT